MRPLPIEEKGGVLLVKLRDGALNDVQGLELRQSLYETLANTPSPRVAMDLAGVDFVTSTGIALLIGTKRRVDAAQGKLVLLNLHPEILELFHSMKLTALFDIATDEADALARFPSLPAS